MLKHCCAIFVLIFVFVSNGLCGIRFDDDPSKTLSASAAYGDVFVTVEENDDFPEHRSHGYSEHIISLDNSSANSHVVTLEGPVDSYGSGDHIRKVRQTIALPPGFEIKLSLFLPPVNARGSNLNIIIDGKMQEKELRLEFDSYSGGYYPTDRLVNILLGSNVSYDSFAKEKIPGLQEKKNKTTECKFLAAKRSVEEWPDNWLSYTGYDGIVVKANDISSMPEGVFSAIIKYVRCGGSLLVLGKWDGGGQLADQQVTLEQLQVNYIHFGICAVSEDEDVNKWNSSSWTFVLRELWRPVGKELTRNRTIAKANEEFTVVESLAIPVRGLFLLVLGFAILIGPVNLWVLQRMRKRMWMLVTVPALALLTSGAVFLYAVCTEGFDAHAKTSAITIYDGKTTTATTIGIDAYYCPLTPGGGLHYDRQTELTPLGLEGWGGGRGRVIDWTYDQHLSSGWVTGRVPAHFLIRKSQAAIEPFTITTEGQNQFVVHNNLDVEISRLLYADDQGNVHSAENITAAGRKNLTVTEQGIGEDGITGRWRKIYSSSWARWYRTISTTPENYLTRGMCIAVLAGAPYIEDALPAAEIKSYESVVICLKEGSADASRSK
jgi:hypothetical protein